MPRFSARMGDRGVSIVMLIGLPPKHIHEMTGSEGDHQSEPQAEHYVEQCHVVFRSDVPKIYEDDAEPVEGVEDNRCHQTNFSNTHEGCLVSPDNCVVRLGADPNEGSIEDVHEEKEVDTDAGDAVQNPRPHAFTTAIQSATGDDAFSPRCRSLYGHRR